MVSFMIFTASVWKLLDQRMYLSLNGRSYERISYHTHGRTGTPEVSFGALKAIFLVNMTVTD